MRKLLLTTALAVVSVLLSSRALAYGLEETLVSLAVIYGNVVLLANPVFTFMVSARRETYSR